MKEYAALFDLDGVIIDTESTYTRFWDEIEKTYPTGIPNFAFAIKGTTLENILEHYDSQAVRDDVVARLRRFQDTMTYDLYPGALKFLDELRANGVARALVTSSDARKMDLLFGQLPQLRTYFDVLIDGSMVTRSKPDPEGYMTAARMLGREPQECCVFEDSLQGLKAGRALGGKVVGLATTYPRETVGPMADLTIDSIAEMDFKRFVSLWK